MFHELRLNGFVITEDIAGKIVVLSEGTEVQDALDPTKTYVLKPLEVSQFLAVVSDPGNLSLTATGEIDLEAVPDFTEHSMGAKPAVTEPKYSEGRKVE